MTLLCTPGWVCSSGTSVEVNFGSPNVTARFDVITLITAKANNVTRGFLQCLDEFAMPRGVQIMPKNVCVLSAVSQRKEKKEEKLMFSGLKEKWKPNSNLF